MEAVGVLFGQEREEKQQRRLGVWVESEEGDVWGGLAPNPSCPRPSEPCCSPPPRQPCPQLPSSPDGILFSAWMRL